MHEPCPVCGYSDPGEARPEKLTAEKLLAMGFTPLLPHLFAITIDEHTGWWTELLIDPVHRRASVRTPVSGTVDEAVLTIALPKTPVDTVDDVLALCRVLGAPAKRP